jgi:hypothetical protein
MISHSDTTLALRIAKTLQEYFNRERIVKIKRYNEDYGFLRKGNWRNEKDLRT